MSDENQLPHLRISRTEHETQRRSGGNPRPKPPSNLKAHVGKLRADLRAVSESPLPTTGFDARRLLKVEAQIGDPADLERMVPGLSVVSQEGKTLTILFATESALATFRTRLDQLERTGKTAYKQLFWNITSVANLASQDRRGRVLRREGLPGGSMVVLDVELWPLDLVPERRAMVQKFRDWCRLNKAEVLDALDATTVVVFRLRAQVESVDELLEHRDVRLVDLPPRFGFDFKVLATPIDDFGPVASPREGAPTLAVLDTGVAGNHPLIAPALGDAQSFTNGASADDENGHGTHVCGLALYGDIERCAAARTFTPKLRLLSGRISDSGDTDRASNELLERRIEAAVTYFVENYGCKVFVLTFCDNQRPYRGGHVDRLASFIDELAERFDVLFVLPTGNRTHLPTGSLWKAHYPDYLRHDDGRILDPAPALNALTVGSVARHEQGRLAQRFPHDPRQTAVARRDEPSPFSRCGPGPGGATKPDLVDHGGNYTVDLTGGSEQLLSLRDLGEISLNSDFAGGNLFVLDTGTSQAAPKVGHVAARLLEQIPKATPDLLRALVVAHAEIPAPTVELLKEEGCWDIVGHGRPRLSETMWSNERRVTLWMEGEIADDKCQFFEIPIPADFLKSPMRRLRRITVALSHMPRVRRTRFDYRSCRMDFRIVRGASMDEISTIFRKQPTKKRASASQEATREDDGSGMPTEPAGVTPTISQRKPSTVQRATWSIKQTDKSWATKPPFIVITSRPPVWGRTEGHTERYALVVVIEDLSAEKVQLYSQIRAKLDQRARARVRR
ncbi:MAG: S8 family peptidase [Enhygromyxa sp.]